MSKAQKTKQSNIKFPSELRLDVVSKDWVVIATGRAKRPEMFKEKEKKEKVPKENCPFCKIENQETPTLIFSHGKKVILKKGNEIPKNWTTVVVPNKYPAFMRGDGLHKRMDGKFYQKMNAVGSHEVLVTRDHDRHLALLPITQVKEVIDAYQARYLELMSKPFVDYIAIFHNHGKEAGASIYHPHSQIITTPLIDPDLQNALSSAKRYYKTHKKCLYCQMGNWERKAKKRIIFENKYFVVLCPFASKVAFEVIISPKKHSPYFEKITEKEKLALAEALKLALFKLYKGLGNPSYNFYLHTAPADRKQYPFYHWHFTILPKTSIHAGFELGAGMEISTIEPEKAAEYLRKQ